MNTKEIWTLHAKDIKHFILSKVKDTTIANDLLQDTFIKIHTKSHHLKDSNKLKPWVFSIARHTVQDHFRNKQIRYNLNDKDFISEEQKQEHTKTDCLHAIIKNLPKKYRDPLFLSDIKGLKQAEIAKQLKLSLPTVKSQIQRARKMIMQGFVACCDFIVNEDGFLVGEVKDKADCKMCH